MLRSAFENLYSLEFKKRMCAKDYMYDYEC